MEFDLDHLDVKQLPQDVELLQQVIVGLLEDRVEREREIRRLIHILEKMLRHRYGQRRERVDPNQLFLFAVAMVNSGQDLEEPQKQEKAEPDKQRKRRRKGHGRNSLPKDLPRERRVYRVPEAERKCGHCGDEMRVIGTERQSRVEWKPASLVVYEEECEKVACPNGCTVVTAEKPVQPIEKGLAGPGLLAHVAVSKYADHIPLHRQEVMFKRQGIHLARSTLCDWMRACALLLLALWELMKQRVLSSSAMQTDDTPVAVLDRQRTRTRQGRIWTYVGDRENPYTVFDYTPNRSRDGPMKFMEEYEGYLQADAYAGYDGLYEDENRNVTEVGCWAHVRRKHFEAQTSDPMRSMVMLAWIRLLYAVEREARELGLDDDGRLALRQEKSVPILTDIHEYLKREQMQVVPKSPEAMAIGYTLSNWEALMRYCEDGALEIDNNGAERSLRGVCVGRKNWLYFGSDQGGQTAAILMSFTTTCKRLGVDPFAYLRDVLERISTHPINRLEELLPDRWREAHPEAVTN